uniref:GYF domain-containing protein n=1 Tax=Schistocephalus solidus TaxID=70667 RepID=A0A0X3Q1A0_SCHSO
MSQFTEAVLHNKIRPSSIHESVVQDSHICQSDILQLYGQIPDLCRTCSSDFPGGMPLDNRNSLSHSAYQAKVDQGEPFGDPGANSGMSGMTPDLLGHRMAFNDPPYSGLPPDAFSSSWKSAVSNASGHSQFSPFNQASSRPVGLQSAPFGNRINTNCGFYGANSTPSVNNSSTETAAEGIFPEEGTGPAWCATAWSENLVTGSDVHAWDKPLTSLRCREGGPESIIPGSDSERAWRYRTSSDSGRVSPHKRNSGATRSRQGSQRRRGRTLSGGSSTSADGFNGINLPSGQAFDAGDFDMPAKEPTPATSVLSTSAQPHDLGHSDSSPMSDPTYQPLGTSSKKLREASYLTPPHDSSLSMQDTDLSQSKLGVLGQVDFAYGMEFPTDEKTDFHSDEHLWLYEDPQGRVQGEFGDAQMQSWLLAGRYFTTSLRIRRKCDDTFSTLADYIKLFGRTPFVPGPRIPPLRGAITQEMIIQVRALLAIQQRAVLTAVNGPLDIRHQIPSTIPLSTGFNSTTSAVVDSSDGDKYPKINVPGSVGSNMQMDLKNGLTSLCGMSLSGWDADSSQRQQELPQLMMLKRLMQNLNPGGGGSGGGAPLNSLAILNTISDILAKTKPESRDAVLSGTTRPLNFNPAFSAPVQFADVCNGLQQSQALALAQLLSAAVSALLTPYLLLKVFTCITHYTRLFATLTFFL